VGKEPLLGSPEKGQREAAGQVPAKMSSWVFERPYPDLNVEDVDGVVEFRVKKRDTCVQERVST
jgi:hypothetical protein